jgi:putative FmdB family regulatory protein
MPLYDYRCEGCGPFEEWRAMRDAAKDITCPSCGGRARWAISAPNISTISSAYREGSARNERSADEPGVVTRSPSAMGEGAKKSHGHAHGPRRPWMIGH